MLEKILILITGILKKSILIAGFTQGVGHLKQLEPKDDFGEAIGDNLPHIFLK